MGNVLCNKNNLVFAHFVHAQYKTGLSSFQRPCNWIQFACRFLFYFIHEHEFVPPLWLNRFASTRTPTCRIINNKQWPFILIYLIILNMRSAFTCVLSPIYRTSRILRINRRIVPSQDNDTPIGAIIMQRNRWRHGAAGIWSVCHAYASSWASYERRQ